MFLPWCFQRCKAPRSLRFLSSAEGPTPEFGRAIQNKDLDRHTQVVNALRREQVVRGVPVARIDDDGKGVVALYVRKDRQLYEFNYAGALPGERLHLRVELARHDRFRGRKQPGKYRLSMVARGAASPEEVTPECQHFSRDKCGGCTFQHLAYTAQLREKQAWLLSRIDEYGLHGAKVRDITPSTCAYGYHSRTEFKFFLRDGPQMGLHPEGSPVPVVITRCHLHPAASQCAFEATIKAVRMELDAMPFDERTGKGWLCTAAFRAAARQTGGHEVLVTLTTVRDAPMERLRCLAARILDGCVDVVGVTWSIEGGEPVERSPGWRSHGSTQQTLLAGRSHLVHYVSSLPFESSPEAFCRPNLFLLDEVLRRVEELCAGGTGTLWDAFCGQGFLAFFLLARQRCSMVVAIDRSAPALNALERNLCTHGFRGQAHIVCADLGSPAELRALSTRLPSAASEDIAADLPVARTRSVQGPAAGGVQHWDARTRIDKKCSWDGVACADSSPGDSLPPPDILLADPGRNGMPKEIAPFDSHPHSSRFELAARLQWRGPAG